ncbi:MAG TPA: PEPxxWA-CTERM sorting domain-containing protein [Novosphingobium sp.]
MSKALFCAAVAALLPALAPLPAGAVTISTTYEADGQLPGYTSAQVIQPFDYGIGNFTAPALPSLGVGITQSETGSNSIRFGNSGPVVRPAAAEGNYLAVHFSADPRPASYVLSFANPVQFVSFVFGSLDPFNSVQLSFANGDLLTLTGAQIAKGISSAVNDFSGLSGGAGAAQGRASYNMNGGPGLASIAFVSTGRAFEIDSIAIAAPEPATWAMLLLGFGLAGTTLRRRRGRAPAVS